MILLGMLGLWERFQDVPRIRGLFEWSMHCHLLGLSENVFAKEV